MGGVGLRSLGLGIGLAIGFAAPALADDQRSDNPDRSLFVHFSPEDFSAASAPYGDRQRLTLSPSGDAISVTSAWRPRGDHAVDGLRLEQQGPWVRADGAPLPPAVGEAAGLHTETYELSYIRGWRAPAIEAGGLEMAGTPHAGVGFGSDGLAPRAGASLTIGERIDKLAPEGREAFGERGRWYLFAAGEGRAVGYNFARTRDGDYVRSGLSQDRGAYIGDASVGVAWRRGDMQASFGYVYREHKISGWRTSETLDRERSEGLVAFQLSIKPDW